MKGRTSPRKHGETKRRESIGREGEIVHSEEGFLHESSISPSHFSRSSSSSSFRSSPPPGPRSPPQDEDEEKREDSHPHHGVDSYPSLRQQKTAPPSSLRHRTSDILSPSFHLPSSSSASSSFPYPSKESSAYCKSCGRRRRATIGSRSDTREENSKTIEESIRRHYSPSDLHSSSSSISYQPCSPHPSLPSSSYTRRADSVTQPLSSSCLSSASPPVSWGRRTLSLVNFFSQSSPSSSSSSTGVSRSTSHTLSQSGHARPTEINPIPLSSSSNLQAPGDYGRRRNEDDSGKGGMKVVAGKTARNSGRLLVTCSSSPSMSEGEECREETQEGKRREVKDRETPFSSSFSSSLHQQGGRKGEGGAPEPPRPFAKSGGNYVPSSSVPPWDCRTSPTAKDVFFLSTKKKKEEEERARDEGEREEEHLLPGRRHSSFFRGNVCQTSSLSSLSSLPAQTGPLQKDQKEEDRLPPYPPRASPHMSDRMYPPPSHHTQSRSSQPSSASFHPSHPCEVPPFSSSPSRGGDDVSFLHKNPHPPGVRDSHHSHSSSSSSHASRERLAPVYTGPSNARPPRPLDGPERGKRSSRRLYTEPSRGAPAAAAASRESDVSTLASSPKTMSSFLTKFFSTFSRSSTGDVATTGDTTRCEGERGGLASSSSFVSSQNAEKPTLFSSFSISGGSRRSSRDEAQPHATTSLMVSSSSSFPRRQQEGESFEEGRRCGETLLRQREGEEKRKEREEDQEQRGGRLSMTSSTATSSTTGVGGGNVYANSTSVGGKESQYSFSPSPSSSTSSSFVRKDSLKTRSSLSSLIPSLSPFAFYRNKLSGKNASLHTNQERNALGTAVSSSSSSSSSSSPLTMSNSNTSSTTTTTMTRSSQPSSNVSNGAATFHHSGRRRSLDGKGGGETSRETVFSNHHLSSSSNLSSKNQPFLSEKKGNGPSPGIGGGGGRGATRSPFTSSFLSGQAETTVQPLIVYDTGGVNIEVAVDPSHPSLLLGTATGLFTCIEGGDGDVAAELIGQQQAYGDGAGGNESRGSSLKEQKSHGFSGDRRGERRRGLRGGRGLRGSRGEERGRGKDGGDRAIIRQDDEKTSHSATRPFSSSLSHCESFSSTRRAGEGDPREKGGKGRSSYPEAVMPSTSCLGRTGGGGSCTGHPNALEPSVDSSMQMMASSSSSHNGNYTSETAGGEPNEVERIAGASPSASWRDAKKVTERAPTTSASSRSSGRYINHSQSLLAQQLESYTSLNSISSVLSSSSNAFSQFPTDDSKHVSQNVTGLSHLLSSESSPPMVLLKERDGGGGGEGGESFLSSSPVRGGSFGAGGEQTCSSIGRGSSGDLPSSPASIDRKKSNSFFLSRLSSRDSAKEDSRGHDCRHLSPRGMQRGEEEEEKERERSSDKKYLGEGAGGEGEGSSYASIESFNSVNSSSSFREKREDGDEAGGRGIGCSSSSFVSRSGRNKASPHDQGRTTPNSSTGPTFSSSSSPSSSSGGRQGASLLSSSSSFMPPKTSSSSAFSSSSLPSANLTTTKAARSSNPPSSFSSASPPPPPPLSPPSSSSSLYLQQQQKKKKVYYYYGETRRNRRHGWGMLVNDERCLLEAQWNNDIVLGWYICYHEYTTEFGYRGLNSVAAVSVASDSNCFIVPVTPPPQHISHVQEKERATTGRRTRRKEDLEKTRDPHKIAGSQSDIFEAKKMTSHTGIMSSSVSLSEKKEKTSSSPSSSSLSSSSSSLQGSHQNVGGKEEDERRRGDLPVGSSSSPSSSSSWLLSMSNSQSRGGNPYLHPKAKEEGEMKERKRFLSSSSSLLQQAASSIWAGLRSHKRSSTVASVVSQKGSSSSSLFSSSSFPTPSRQDDDVAPQGGGDKKNDRDEVIKRKGERDRDEDEEEERGEKEGRLERGEVGVHRSSYSSQENTAEGPSSLEENRIVENLQQRHSLSQEGKEDEEEILHDRTVCLSNTTTSLKTSEEEEKRREDPHVLQGEKIGKDGGEKEEERKEKTSFIVRPTEREGKGAGGEEEKKLPYEGILSRAGERRMRRRKGLGARGWVSFSSGGEEGDPHHEEEEEESRRNSFVSSSNMLQERERSRIEEEEERRRRSGQNLPAPPSLPLHPQAIHHHSSSYHHPHNSSHHYERRDKVLSQVRRGKQKHRTIHSGTAFTITITDLEANSEDDTSPLSILPSRSSPSLSLSSSSPGYEVGKGMRECLTRRGRSDGEEEKTEMRESQEIRRRAEERSHPLFAQSHSCEGTGGFLRGRDKEAGEIHSIRDDTDRGGKAEERETKSFVIENDPKEEEEGNHHQKKKKTTIHNEGDPLGGQVPSHLVNSSSSPLSSSFFPKKIKTRRITSTAEAAALAAAEVEEKLGGRLPSGWSSSPSEDEERMSSSFSFSSSRKGGRKQGPLFEREKEEKEKLKEEENMKERYRDDDDDANEREREALEDGEEEDRKMKKSSTSRGEDLSSSRRLLFSSRSTKKKKKKGEDENGLTIRREEERKERVLQVHHGSIGRDNGPPPLDTSSLSSDDRKHEEGDSRYERERAEKDPFSATKDEEREGGVGQEEDRDEEKRDEGIRRGEREASLKEEGWSPSKEDLLLSLRDSSASSSSSVTTTTTTTSMPVATPSIIQVGSSVDSRSEDDAGGFLGFEGGGGISKISEEEGDGEQEERENLSTPFSLSHRDESANLLEDDPVRITPLLIHEEDDRKREEETQEQEERKEGKKDTTPGLFPSNGKEDHKVKRGRGRKNTTVQGGGGDGSTETNQEEKEEEVPSSTLYQSHAKLQSFVSSSSSSPLSESLHPSVISHSSSTEDLSFASVERNEDSIKSSRPSPRGRHEKEEDHKRESQAMDNDDLARDCEALSLLLHGQTKDEGRRRIRTSHETRECHHAHHSPSSPPPLSPRACTSPSDDKKEREGLVGDSFLSCSHQSSSDQEDGREASPDRIQGQGRENKRQDEGGISSSFSSSFSTKPEGEEEKGAGDDEVLPRQDGNEEISSSSSSSSSSFSRPSRRRPLTCVPCVSTPLAARAAAALSSSISGESGRDEEEGDPFLKRSREDRRGDPLERNERSLVREEKEGHLKKPMLLSTPSDDFDLAEKQRRRLRRGCTYPEFTTQENPAVIETVLCEGISRGRGDPSQRSSFLSHHLSNSSSFSFCGRRGGPQGERDSRGGVGDHVGGSDRSAREGEGEGGERERRFRGAEDDDEDAFFQAAFCQPFYFLRASDSTKWSTNTLCQFLRLIGVVKEASLFKLNRLCGADIPTLTSKKLAATGITDRYVRKFLLTVFRYLWSCSDHLDPLLPVNRRHLRRRRKRRKATGGGDGEGEARQGVKSSSLGRKEEKGGAFLPSSSSEGGGGGRGVREGGNFERRNTRDACKGEGRMRRQEEEEKKKKELAEDSDDDGEIKMIASKEVRVGRCIGGGGYATVHKAKYRGMDVACKIFKYKPNGIYDPGGEEEEEEEREKRRERKKEPVEEGRRGDGDRGKGGGGRTRKEKEERKEGGGLMQRMTGSPREEKEEERSEGGGVEGRKGGEERREERSDREGERRQMKKMNGVSSSAWNAIEGHLVEEREAKEDLKSSFLSSSSQNSPPPLSSPSSSSFQSDLYTKDPPREVPLQQQISHDSYPKTEETKKGEQEDGSRSMLSEGERSDGYDQQQKKEGLEEEEEKEDEEDALKKIRKRSLEGKKIPDQHLSSQLSPSSSAPADAPPGLRGGEFCHIPDEEEEEKERLGENYSHLGEEKGKSEEKHLKNEKEEQDEEKNRQTGSSGRSGEKKEKGGVCEDDGSSSSLFFSSSTTSQRGDPSSQPCVRSRDTATRPSHLQETFLLLSHERNLSSSSLTNHMKQDSRRRSENDKKGGERQPDHLLISEEYPASSSSSSCASSSLFKTPSSPLLSLSSSPLHHVSDCVHTPQYEDFMSPSQGDEEEEEEEEDREGRDVKQDQERATRREDKIKARDHLSEKQGERPMERKEEGSEEESSKKREDLQASPKESFLHKKGLTSPRDVSSSSSSIHTINSASSSSSPPPALQKPSSSCTSRHESDFPERNGDGEGDNLCMEKRVFSSTSSSSTTVMSSLPSVFQLHREEENEEKNSLPLLPKSTKTLAEHDKEEEKEKKPKEKREEGSSLPDPPPPPSHLPSPVEEKEEEDEEEEEERRSNKKSSSCLLAYKIDCFRYYPQPIKHRDYEADILAALQSHPNIIRLYGKCHLRPGEEALLIEFCKLGSLDSFIYPPGELMLIGQPGGGGGEAEVV